jgi:predicted transcriptional regulator
MDHHDTLLLSLRPASAAAVLAGEKTVEVRRTPVRAAAGTLVVLYATAPVSAVVGTARLADVRALPPDTAWERHRDGLAMTGESFSAYLSGVGTAHLLLLRGAVALSPPLELRDLRQDHPFRPPRSFRYLHPDDPAPLRALIPG